MEDNQEIIIEIETNYSEAVKLMAQYRAEAYRFRQANADLKKELKEGKISQEEYNIQTAAKPVIGLVDSGVVSYVNGNTGKHGILCLGRA